MAARKRKTVSARLGSPPPLFLVPFGLSAVLHFDQRGRSQRPRAVPAAAEDPDLVDQPAMGAAGIGGTRCRGNVSDRQRRRHPRPPPPPRTLPADRQRRIPSSIAHLDL